MTVPAPTPATAGEEAPLARWTEASEPRQALWRSEAGWPPPRRIEVVDDRETADAAFRKACEGTALLWRGDFHNARQLLSALDRRIARAPRRRGEAAAPLPAPGSEAMAQAFHRHRQAQGRRARLLSMVLVEVDGAHAVPLRRAPPVAAACSEAWGPAGGPSCLVALRELLGVVGAHEWRRQGVALPALGPGPDNRIHPHYGVFSPVRGEYLDLLAQAPLPADTSLAFDLGTGTGVIAALLARRGVARVQATDTNPRALACAADNLQRLGLSSRVELLPLDLFPPGRAPLVVCNPPWLPGRPVSSLESAVYDPEGRMLAGFLSGLRDHLAPGGEGWLVLSDLAEWLGLRPVGALQAQIEAAGLRVVGRTEVRPRHPKASDATDPLAVARTREMTSLWRLVAA